MDMDGRLLQLEWREEKEELDMVHRIQTGIRYTGGMCFLEKSNILVITSGQTIKAINHVTGSVLWEFFTECR